MLSKKFVYQNVLIPTIPNSNVGQQMHSMELFHKVLVSNSSSTIGLPDPESRLSFIIVIVTNISVWVSLRVLTRREDRDDLSFSCSRDVTQLETNAYKNNVLEKCAKQQHRALFTRPNPHKYGIAKCENQAVEMPQFRSHPSLSTFPVWSVLLAFLAIFYYPVYYLWAEKVSVTKTILLQIGPPYIYVLSIAIKPKMNLASGNL